MIRSTESETTLNRYLGFKFSVVWDAIANTEFLKE